MASLLRYKVYDAQHKYQGSTKTIQAAGALAQFYGHGATLRLGHAKYDTLWIVDRNSEYCRRRGQGAGGEVRANGLPRYEQSPTELAKIHEWALRVNC